MTHYDRVAQALRSRFVVSDDEFDVVYSPPWRRASACHWTPVHIALLAAQWLTATGAKRVLDLGAGPGKLCIIGALSTGVEFVGVEQRAHLVHAGRDAARRLGVAEKVTLKHGVVDRVDWARYDAAYVYNPFAENVHPEDQVDGTVELSPARFERDVSWLERALDHVPVGWRLVTYHGFGGRMPDTFDCKAADSGSLRLWVKEREQSTVPNRLNLDLDATNVAYGDFECADA